MNFLRLIILPFLFMSVANADVDGAFLDPLYKNLQPPDLSNLKDHGGLESSREDTNRTEILRSDVESVIANQTSVKAQGGRGTCSIFSATALLESMLVIKKEFSKDIDLSEEWLEYLAVRTKTSDGSNSWTNFNMIRRYGMPLEETLPYIGVTWETLPGAGLAFERCGHLEESERLLKSCLLAHRDPRLLITPDEKLLDEESELHDPEFVNVRSEAAEFRNEFINFTNTWYGVRTVGEIKRLLREGTPLTMGIEFFYGAWNHRVTGELGIPRNMKHWDEGIVGYPEIGSIDRKKSRTQPAGHSIVIVGYDDEVEIEVDTKMEDGSTKTFKYKGVYYFKNSWGKGNFGKNMQIKGVNHDGYGMITQKYAHEFGGFYQMPLQ